MKRRLHLLQWHLHVHLIVEKGMLQSILSTDAMLGVFLEHLGQQVKRREGHLRIALLGKSKITGPILSQYFVILLALENRSPEEQVVEDDAGRKDVTNRVAFSTHVPDIDDLRSHKARGPTPNKKIFLLVRISSQPEIADGGFPAFLLLEHDVLWLQVPMNYPVLGQVGQASEDILYYLFCIVMLDLYTALR